MQKVNVRTSKTGWMFTGKAMILSDIISRRFGNWRQLGITMMANKGLGAER